MRRAHCLPALLLAATALAADPPAPPTPVVGPDARVEVAVTVYDQDLALVKDTRELTLAAGESALRFEDVAQKIDPRTVAVRSTADPDALEVVEQRFLFDQVSPEKLMERAVGQEVELVETGERLRTKVTKATLLSVAGGPVYRIGERIALGYPGRVVLPKLPEELSGRPTLLWLLANRGPARQRVEVSYLTGGLGWAADYVAMVHGDDTRADLTGWVTLTNQSGARYDGATLKLVAGKVSRAQGAERPLLGERMVARAAAAPKLTEEELFEYHLYTLDRRATLADNESRQLRLLSASGIALKKSFLIVGQPAWYRSRHGELGRDVPVGVFLEFRNDAANHLGVPLPAGVVRLYKRDKAGAVQFIGEDAIRHTPKDERVLLKAGDAFDVVATRVQTDYREIDVEPYDVEVAFAVTIRNRRREAVVVSVKEPLGGDWKVVESSVPPVKLDARTLGFEVSVPRDAETVVSYRAQVAY
jgi:hypothetical protein